MHRAFSGSLNQAASSLLTWINVMVIIIVQGFYKNSLRKFWEKRCMYVFGENFVQKYKECFMKMQKSRQKNLGLILLVVGLFVSCASTPSSTFDSFRDNLVYRNRFVGIWEQQYIGSSIITYEFWSDGNGVRTVFRPDGTLHTTIPIRFRTSSSHIMIHFLEGNTVGRAEYHFTGANTLSLINIYGQSSGGRRLQPWNILSLRGTYTRTGVARQIMDGADIETALERGAIDVSEHFTAGSRVAIVYIAAEDASLIDFISGELEHILRRQGFIIVDRFDLARIRAEQLLGLFGEVDDNTAARIGHLAGATIVVTGGIDGEGDLRRLRLRAMDTTTGQVVGTASERL